MKPEEIEEIILAIETTHAKVSIALAKDGENLAKDQFIVKRGLAAQIFPAISDLLKSANMTLADITRLAVNRGPGRYTGIRIGLGAVQGWQTALNIPATGVDSFQLLHHYARQRSGDNRPVTVVLPSVRQLIYLQSFDVHGSRDYPPKTMPMAQLADEINALPDQYIIAGGPMDAGDRLDTRHIIHQGVIDPDADLIIDYIASKGGRGQGDLSPLYIRQPDAMPPAPVFPSLQST